MMKRLWGDVVDMFWIFAEAAVLTLIPQRRKKTHDDSDAPTLTDGHHQQG